MSSEDPRERDDLCGRELVGGDSAGDLAEAYDPSTWYEAEDGTDYCCREVWDVADDGRCIWHADVAAKPADALAAARSAEPARLDRAVLRESDLPDGVSLSECRLRFADLDVANLRDADLGGANLRGADLGRAALQDADLTEADLAEADLSEADLAKADLTEADLAKADLSGTNLAEADLSEADLVNADISGAIFVDADLGGADLRRADLSETDLLEADLGGADLYRAELGGARLQEADVGGANLRNADLGGANLRNADLGGANLRDGRLSDARFQDADLTDADLERADCTRANFFRAGLTGAALYGAVLANVQLNLDTSFGDHYPADPDKAAWTLRQLERLFRENALPGQARDAYLDRKDRRRRQYWYRALVPGPVRRVVAGGKAWARRVRRGVGARLAVVGTGSREIEASGRADEATEATAAGPEDLSRGERLVATVRWARAAAVGVTTRYAASPWRVVGVSLAVIAGSTVAYQLVGPLVRSPRPAGAGLVGGDLVATVPVGLPAWLGEWLTSLYFSVVTFTTLGYGDLRPATGAAQAVATVESFVGAFLLALLVYVFGRRATR